MKWRPAAVALDISTSIVTVTSAGRLSICNTMPIADFCNAKSLQFGHNEDQLVKGVVAITRR